MILNWNIKLHKAYARQQTGKAEQERLANEYGQSKHSMKRSVD